MGVTIKDIAGMLGITPSAVSRALQDSPKISVATRERVRELADRLGYVPNTAARNLKASRTGFISLLFSANKLTEIQAEWFACLSRYAWDLGYHVRIDPLSAMEKVVVSKSADGLILPLSPTRIGADGLRAARNAGIPMVFVDCEPVQANAVWFDNRSAARDAVGMLSALGHRRMAFVGRIKGAPVAEERWRGFMEGMTATNGGCDAIGTVEFRNWPFDIRDIDPHMPEILGLVSSGCTAVMASSDVAGAAIVRGLTQAGVKVPESVSVLCFDDTLLARASVPALTVLRQDIDAAARMSTAMLAGIMDGGERAAPVSVPLEYIGRGSVGPAPQ